MIEERDKYIGELAANRRAGARREVYVDTSHETVQGTRYVLAGAVMGPAFIEGQLPVNSAEHVLRQDAADRAGLVPGSLWTYSMESLAAGKSMSQSSFITWFEDGVLANLHSPSLIVMSRSALHCARPAGTPDPSDMQRDELLAELSARGLTCAASSSLLCELRTMLREHLSSTVRPAVVALAESRGHRVVYLPAKHDFLNPMRILISHVRGRLAANHHQHLHQHQLLHQHSGGSAAETSSELELPLQQHDGGLKEMRDAYEDASTSKDDVIFKIIQHCWHICAKYVMDDGDAQFTTADDHAHHHRPRQHRAGYNSTSTSSSSGSSSSVRQSGHALIVLSSADEFVFDDFEDDAGAAADSASEDEYSSGTEDV